jgi:hypothetical protein
MVSENTTFPENNHTTTEVINFFEDASEQVDEIQDNNGFLGYLASEGIEYDDTQESFWEAVQFVSNRSVELGLKGDPTSPEVRAFQLAAAGPSSDE